MEAELCTEQHKRIAQWGDNAKIRRSALSAAQSSAKECERCDNVRVGIVIRTLIAFGSNRNRYRAMQARARQRDNIEAVQAAELGLLMRQITLAGGLPFALPWVPRVCFCTVISRMALLAGFVTMIRDQAINVIAALKAQSVCWISKPVRKQLMLYFTRLTSWKMHSASTERVYKKIYSYIIIYTEE